MIPTYKPKKISAKKVTFKMIGENAKPVKVKKYTPKKVTFKKMKAKKCCMRK